ncbi:barstar family protein [Labedaea rhizosphaerae]|uniref:Barstar (Barnase inhibitor) n=1 Tax=Labedaea rhizosphaerae TaxID=598644 RepID=A0A4R6RPZ4_LABRH|nr:barstar family protein [Labedaea rhizosphaerae]TDP88849.1 barstar (barnase inhibitor) [Labedaea rhizosphaerae]
MSNLPLFRLVDYETDRTILSAADVEGFFDHQSLDEQSSLRITFRGVAEIDTTVSRLEEGALWVVDSSGKCIGEYYCGDTKIDHSMIGTDARVRALVCATTEELNAWIPNIWRQWSSRMPVSRGQWVGENAKWTSGWLHVVRMSWFATQKPLGVLGEGNEFLLDCTQVHTMDEMFIALGEAFNGPGGYFGSNLDAVEDCLRSSTRDLNTVVLRLVNSDRLKRIQDQHALGTLWEIMDLHDVSVMWS